MQVRLFDQDHGMLESLGLRIGGFGYSTDVVDLDEAAFAALEASTPGSSAASCARDRTGRTPICDRCSAGSSD